MKRSLSLKREPLAELSGHELAGVAGAALPTTPPRECVAALTPRTVDVRECVSGAHTCIDCITRWC